MTEHVVSQGWWSQCDKWGEAPLEGSQEVVGQGRFGVKIAYLIASMPTVLRLPGRQVQADLATLAGLTIRSGEMVELSHRVKVHLEPQMAALKQEMRASPAVQADETSWREDGVNGSIWRTSTPQRRYDEYHHSRGSEVVDQLLGGDLEGMLGSDFYAASTISPGLHQHGWVHLLRDIHEFKEQHHTAAELQQVGQGHQSALPPCACLCGS